MPQTSTSYTPAKGTPLAEFVREAAEGSFSSSPSSDGLPSVEEASLLAAALERSARRVAAALSRAGIDDRLGKSKNGRESNTSDAGRDAPKELDIVANDILKEELSETGVVSLLASEEDEEVVGVENENGNSDSSFVAVFDPLDGSSNIAACIPTGTIFGIYRRRTSRNSNDRNSDLLSQVLRPGKELVLAGYSLYSSATMLVLTLSGGDEGAGTHGFTLDPESDRFVCTHPRIRVPERGQFYSLNDARFDDWSDDLRRYVVDVRSGKSASGKQYAARYVCSLVADLHRTLLYGGWAGNPRSHLRRVYEAAPLAAVTRAAGGRATDGENDVLEVTPEALHSRAPFFAGSKLDIEELLSYGDVRQTGKKKYDV